MQRPQYSRVTVVSHRWSTSLASQFLVSSTALPTALPENVTIRARRRLATAVAPEYGFKVDDVHHPFIEARRRFATGSESHGQSADDQNRRSPERQPPVLGPGYRHSQGWQHLPTGRLGRLRATLPSATGSRELAQSKEARSRQRFPSSEDRRQDEFLSTTGFGSGPQRNETALVGHLMLSIRVEMAGSVDAVLPARRRTRGNETRSMRPRH